MNKKNDLPNSAGLRVRIAPLRWEGSVVLWLAALLNNVLACLSPMTLAEWHYPRDTTRGPPFWMAEGWVAILLLAEIDCLIWGNPGNIFILLLGVYFLLEVLGVTLEDLIAAPLRSRCTTGRSRSETRHGPRWLLMALLTVVQVVLGFAILFLYCGKEFRRPIDDPITAVYQSALTFTTLGYGDIRPTSWVGRTVVCSELAFFLLFLVAKLPIAVSVLTVAEEHKEGAEVHPHNS